MTGRPDEQAEVRRLLAEARHTEPMPDDVKARMDDVLAGLAHREPEREGAASVGPSATVTPLVSRRRLRLASGLVAAAAVVVGAVLAAPHLSSSSSSSATESGSGVAGPARSPGSNQISQPGRNTGKSAGPSKSLAPHAFPSRLTPDGRVLVRPHHFSADARAVQRQLRRDGVAAFDSLRTVRCADVPPGGEGLAVEYRHAPAALVFHPAQQGSQVVDLYACGTSTPLRSATLPVP